MSRAGFLTEYILGIGPAFLRPSFLARCRFPLQVSNLDRLDSGLDKISPLFFSLHLPSRRFSRVSKETRSRWESERERESPFDLIAGTNRTFDLVAALRGAETYLRTSR